MAGLEDRLLLQELEATLLDQHDAGYRLATKSFAGICKM